MERRRDVPEPLADKFARWSTAPWPGIPLFLGVSLAAFLAVILVGGWLAGVLGAAWSATVSPFLAAAVPAVVPVPILASAHPVGPGRRDARACCRWGSRTC